MQFVKHGLLPKAPRPGAVFPLERPGIDDLAGAVDTEGLIARSRIRNLVSANREMVVSARRSFAGELEPAVHRTNHRQAAGTKIQASVLSFRRPQSEPYPAPLYNRCSEGHFVCAVHGP